MIKQEIIEKISKYFKLTDFESEEIYEDIFSGIIEGVKEDNIADITNLGEFIIKYSNEVSGYKKTVEFLSTVSLEEEINRISFEEQRTFEPPPFVSQTYEIYDENKIEKPVIQNTETKPSPEDETSVEEGIKKKREEILSKITTPKEEHNIVSDFPGFMESSKENIQETEDKTSEPSEIAEKKDEVEEVTEKSFSDYFEEVKQEQKIVREQVSKTAAPPVVNLVPPAAVELHNQITGDHNKNMNYSTAVNQEAFTKGNGNGNGGNNENIITDNSYYIWYKDSEPNTADTQTMSYEYELLYQATKEAEYKSRLRIYVTTFILFFSIVLMLLIFSPVLYKYFFTPRDIQQNNEEIQQETGSNNTEPNTGNTNNHASVNSLQENSAKNNTNTNVTSPTANIEQNNTEQTQKVQQEQPKQEQPKQEQPKQEQPKKEQPKQEQPKVKQPFVKEKNTIGEQKSSSKQNNTQISKSITKNALGWMDETNKVIYIQLDNGKFTIQESSWDSQEKADKRLSTVAGMIPGFKGNVISADLGAKGIWYRSRFGEFSTLEEAQAKAVELRNKERMKLHALLLDILLYT